MTKILSNHIVPNTEREKLRAVATVRKLGGLANDTKWKELIESCYTMDWKGPFYRCKCIDSEYISSLDGGWHEIPYPPSAIEWLDIYYLEKFKRGNLLAVETIDHSGEIEAALKRIGFDYKKGKECFRIFGYTPRNEEGFVEYDGTPT